MDTQVFVARQPILDRTRRVVAYELLFRPSVAAAKAGTQSECATARLITNAVLTFGLPALTHGTRAFINVPRRLLVDGLPESFPAAEVVLELLEDIEADEEVLDACRTFRRGGYAIALDDFVLSARTRPLLDVADYVKVDVLTTHPEARRAIVQARGPDGPQLLAEKVETAEQFQTALAEGFTYFQGFFFGRPVTRTTRDIPAHRLTHLRLLQAMRDPDLSVSSSRPSFGRTSACAFACSGPSIPRRSPSRGASSPSRTRWCWWAWVRCAAGSRCGCSQA